MIMTEDVAYTVVSFVIARSATFLQAAEKRLLAAAAVLNEKSVLCTTAFADPHFDFQNVESYLDMHMHNLGIRLKQVIPEYVGKEIHELDDRNLDNGNRIINEFINVIYRRLHDTRCQRLERAEGILKEFRLHLFALHKAARPKGRKPRNPAYASAIESATGELPVQPMRADILTKLKYLLPEWWIWDKGKPTDELGEFKRITRTIQMML
jgi:hypothetical protein